MIDYDGVQRALRARLVAVTGVDATQAAWEGVRFTPTDGTPYLREQFVPASGIGLTMPITTGMVEYPGLYVIDWYGVSGAGISTISNQVDAILAAFSPGTTLHATTGDTIYIRSNPAPWRGQFLAEDAFTRCTITIPWLVRATNAVAA